MPLACNGLQGQGKGSTAEGQERAGGTCSAPCVYKEREKGKKRNLPTGVGEGKQGQGEGSGCPAHCCVPCARERGHTERGQGAQGPGGTWHTKGKQPEKGVKEGTGAIEENAGHRVVYHARLASDLSRRRVVGEACRPGG